jgi:hypothetical protein
MRLRLRIFNRKQPPSMVQLSEHGATAFTWGAGFGWLRDVSPAAWIGPRLHPFGQDAGSVIPDGFEAYARLFHPVEVDGRQRWSDIARRNGRIVHPEMQFHLISTPRGQMPTALYGRLEPRHGNLLLEQRRVLVEHLRDRTTTPDRCWFGLWEGFGGLDDGGIRERVALPQRNYLLYGGTIDRALESPKPFDQSPNLWWPEDRAWFVASEIDFAWTHIAGAHSLIATLLSDGRLEALPVASSAKVDSNADRLNAALNS